MWQNLFLRCFSSPHFFAVQIQTQGTEHFFKLSGRLFSKLAAESLLKLKKKMFTSSSIFILLPLYCAFNGRALCLFSCAIHLYIFYPREKSHTEVVLRLHNILWDTDKSHFVRTWSYWIWKTWDCCIFSTDFSSLIISVSFHGSFSPMLSSPQNKVKFSESNSGGKMWAAKILHLWFNGSHTPAGTWIHLLDVFLHLLESCMC